MTHMTLKYDISQFGQSWCLNDRLYLSNHTRSSDFGKQMFKNKKEMKYASTNFPIINFENPSTKLEVKFAVTSQTARNLISFANPNRIKMRTQFPIPNSHLRFWFYETG